MARKDQLAAGARTAKFAVGGTVILGADDNIFRNVAPEGSRDESEIVVERAPVVKKKFRPLGNVILVRRSTVEELSNIILTEAMEKEQPAIGTVVAVGPAVGTLHQGEAITFGKYAGTEFKLNGEVLLLMNIEDVLGVIEDEPLSRFDESDINVGGCIVGRA
jgi:chaperonin GroES